MDQVVREVVESSSVEVFKTQLGVVLDSLFWLSLLEQRLGLDDLKRFLPACVIL